MTSQNSHTCKDPNEITHASLTFKALKTADHLPTRSKTFNNYSFFEGWGGGDGDCRGGGGGGRMNAQLKL